MGTRASKLSTFPPLGPLHYPWVLSVVFKCFANIRITDQSLFYAFMPRESIYTCVFCAVPAFAAEHGRGSCRQPSLFSGSRSPGCDTSFELPFIVWVAFRLDFMAGFILHFIFIACVASSCFTLVFLGVCRLPVSHFWRESLSLVSWCLSYFALHFVFIARVAYKLFSGRVSPSGCFHEVCRLQVVFTAFVAFRLFLRRVSLSL